MNRIDALYEATKAFIAVADALPAGSDAVDRAYQEYIDLLDEEIVVALVEAVRAAKALPLRQYHEGIHHREAVTGPFDPECRWCVARAAIEKVEALSEEPPNEKCQG